MGSVHIPPNGAAKPCTAPNPHWPSTDHRTGSPASGSRACPRACRGVGLPQSPRRTPAALGAQRIGQGIGRPETSASTKCDRRPGRWMPHGFGQTVEQIRIEHRQMGSRCGLRRLTLTLAAGTPMDRIGESPQRRCRPWWGWRQKATAAPAGAAHDHHLQIVEQDTSVGGQSGHGLAGVHGAAAAQPTTAVAALAPAPRQTSRHRFHRRFLIHEPHHRLDASRVSRDRKRSAPGPGRLVVTKMRRTPARAGQPAPPPACRDQTAAARRSRIRSSPRGVWVTLRYFLLVRGSAIMGATVSAPPAIVSGLLVRSRTLGSRYASSKTKRVGSSRSCTTSKRATPGSLTLSQALASVAARNASTS